MDNRVAYSITNDSDRISSSKTRHTTGYSSVPFIIVGQDVPSPAAKWMNPAKAEYGSDGVTVHQLCLVSEGVAYGYRRLGLIRLDRRRR